jgi:PAS domain S-box-containing protein
MAEDHVRTSSTTSPDPSRDVGRFWLEAETFSGTLPELDAAHVDASSFVLLADAIPTLCWIARGDGYIVWYNKRWHAYCGTTPAAMEGWGWQDVHDPAVLPEVITRWTQSIDRGEPFEMVFPLRGADGIFRPFLTRIVPLKDMTGRVVRWFGTNTEIGDQLRAEHERDVSEATYKVLTDAMPQMVWSTLPDGYHDYYNRRWYEFTGVPYGSTDGEAWNGMFHPDDQARAWEIWRTSLRTGQPYEVEYRLRHHSGEYRWTLGRALPVRNERGEIVRWIGTCTDIHAARQAMAHAELLSRELSHRIKNIFAILASLVRISLRRDPSAKSFARDLLDRIQALGRAHEFARPHSDESRPAHEHQTLQGLLHELFAPYVEEQAAPRFHITGDDPEVDDKGATPLALLVHELATNAVKYGALSVPGGRVEIDIRSDASDIVMTWRECGGPKIASDPQHHGFGSRLTSMSVEQQLGGSISRAWKSEGLEVVVRIGHTALVRPKS